MFRVVPTRQSTRRVANLSRISITPIFATRVGPENRFCETLNGEEVALPWINIAPSEADYPANFMMLSTAEELDYITQGGRPLLKLW